MASASERARVKERCIICINLFLFVGQDKWHAFSPSPEYEQYFERVEVNYSISRAQTVSLLSLACSLSYFVAFSLSRSYFQKIFLVAVRYSG